MYGTEYTRVITRVVPVSTDVGILAAPTALFKTDPSEKQKTSEPLNRSSFVPFKSSMKSAIFLTEHGTKHRTQGRGYSLV
jgi:hypothetical protein